MGLELKNFNQFSTVNENVAPAKSLLLKLAKDKKRKKLKLPSTEKIEFTPEEESKILNNPDYIEVRDYFLNTVKKPGLVYPFTYFRIVEGLPMKINDPEGFSVENLNRKIDEVGPMLSVFPLPLGNIESYIKNTPEGDIAYEKLWDDIAVILSKKPIKSFIDKSVGPIRREFTKSLELSSVDAERKNLLDRLYNLVQDLKNLPDLTDEKTGNVKTAKDAEDEFIAYGSKYKDTRTYPEFRDTYIAFKQFIEDLKTKVDGWGSEINTFIEEIESIAPSVKILYYDPSKKIVVTSARSHEGMVSICKVSNAHLCIRGKDAFWKYTSGRLQISINLMDLSKEDPKYLTSFTIKPDRTLYDSANRNNNRVNHTNENYIEFLKRYGIYTQEIADSIEKNFGSELTIKNLVEIIEKKAVDSKNSTLSDKSKLIFYLGSISIQQAIEGGEFTKEEIDMYKDIIISIIKNDYNIKYSETILAFLQPDIGGFFTIEDVDLFKILVESNYRKEDVNSIVDLTEDAIRKLQEFLPQIRENEPKQAKLVQALLDTHPSVMKYVRANL